MSVFYYSCPHSSYFSLLLDPSVFPTAQRALLALTATYRGGCRGRGAIQRDVQLVIFRTVRGQKYLLSTGPAKVSFFQKRRDSRLAGAAALGAEGPDYTVSRQGHKPLSENGCGMPMANRLGSAPTRQRGRRLTLIRVAPRGGRTLRRPSGSKVEGGEPSRRHENGKEREAVGLRWAEC